MPIVVQYLFPAFTGHVIVPHAPSSGLQVTSHLHEVPHATAAHAPLPVQLTLHARGPHVMSPQAAASVHVITQLHVAGHTIAEPLPAPVMLHVPVAKSHEAQAGGQTAASIGLASMFAASIGPPSTQ